MKKRKGLTLLLAAAAALSLAGCGGAAGKSESTSTKAEGGSTELPVLRVATMPTIPAFPLITYRRTDWTRRRGLRWRLPCLTPERL